MNLENCLDVKNMTALEAAQAMKMLATKIISPVGIGIWEGDLTGKISGETYSGEHVAVFQDNALVAPFGFHGDAESEAMAALFVTSVKYAATISDNLVSTLAALEHVIALLETIDAPSSTINLIKGVIAFAEEEI